ncbi:MAG: sugar phosphate isomerase/epimerase [Desulfobacterales bacterium]|nr:sugar phosphate isomerase/epimerase [Desulfobacterales bacterium]
MRPLLKTSYKNRFPFKIGTTSFIYPAGYGPNVKLTGPYLDEIELLFYESIYPNNLPAEDEIIVLKNLSEDLNVSYNVHLPTDVFLGDPDESRRNYAADTIKRFIKTLSPLSPSTHTLHLSYDENSSDASTVNKWQKNVSLSIERLLSAGIDSRSISIETLMYPFEWAEPIIREFNLSVCMDIGHLILTETDFEATFDNYSDVVTIIHLHGVEDGEDHISLCRMPVKEMERVMNILNRYTGVVSLEIFCFRNLYSSLPFLEAYWEKYTQ